MERLRHVIGRNVFLELENLGSESFRNEQDYQRFRKEVIIPYQSFFGVPRGYSLDTDICGQNSAQFICMCESAAKHLPMEELLPEPCQRIWRNNSKWGDENESRNIWTFEK